MNPLTKSRVKELRQAQRFTLEPGAADQAVIRVWLPNPKDGTAQIARSLPIDQRVRGLTQLPGPIPITGIEGLDPWKSFVDAIQVGDVLRLEWTADPKSLDAPEGSERPWRAHLIALRDGKEVTEFAIQAITAQLPGNHPMGQGPGVDIPFSRPVS